MGDLSGKVALVTGAGGRRGFGRAIANRLATDGADVVVTDVVPIPPYRENLTQGWRGIDSVVDEIKALGRQALAFTCDITRSDEVARMVKETLDKFGQINVLVNNAGVHIAGTIDSLTDEDWHKNISVCLTGTFFCSRAVALEMIKRNKGGKIVNIASLSGKRAVAADPGYCAAKFGVVGLTQSMALELAPHGINVNAVCPTIADTDRVSHRMEEMAQREGTSTQEARDRGFSRRIAGIPLGRLATTEDVANMTAFLASKESDFITGQSINVCGGALTAH